MSFPQDLLDFVNREKWTFAKTMPRWSHEYRCGIEWMKGSSFSWASTFGPRATRAASEDLERMLSSPSLVLLSETERHREIFGGVIRTAGAAGNLVHDAHIAALCLEHGVSELITGDRDFSRFPDLRSVNPFS